MVWDVVPVDELNPYSQLNVAALQQLGYRYDYITTPGEHLTPSANDDYPLAATFLGTARVQPNPAHVTYVYAKDSLDGLDRATGDYTQYGIVADHAYWLSGIRLRGSSGSCRGNTSPGCGSTGSIDAMSAGFGLADPAASGPQPGGGVLTGGSLFPALPYTEVKQTWGSAPSQPRTDALTLTVTNVSALTIDVSRAHVDCAARLNVSTDGPLTVTLLGCGKKLSFR
jgi:hypothetical protein